MLYEYLRATIEIKSYSEYLLIKTDIHTDNDIPLYPLSITLVHLMKTRILRNRIQSEI